ncbi:hypothetical protein ACROYT_G006464 [Oculina patagonica]
MHKSFVFQSIYPADYYHYARFLDLHANGPGNIHTGTTLDLIIGLRNRATTMAPEPNTTAEPEPESTPESSAEPHTLFPEIMTNQEAFLMYGVFIFALAVFCIVLLVLYITLKKKVSRLINSSGSVDMKAYK